MNRSKALTLIELLVAVAVTSAISIAIFSFALSSLKAISRAMDASKSNATARLLETRISSDIRQSGGAVTGSGAKILILGSVGYEFMNGKLRRQEGSDIAYLTIEGEISDLSFSYPSAELIRVVMTTGKGAVFSFDAYARN